MITKPWIGVLFSCWFLLISSPLSAQTFTDTTTAISKNRLFGLPIAFYAPETNWGFGAAGISTFRLKGEPATSRPSQLQLGFAYTFNKQWLLYLPFQLFKQNEQYKLYGELGYYLYK